MQRLGFALVLRHPNVTRAFQFSNDWSALDLGAVLSQKMM